MMNGSGREDISTGFERPGVVIRGDAFEFEVSNAVGAKYGGEAAFGGDLCSGRGGGGWGERESLGEVLG